MCISVAAAIWMPQLKRKPVRLMNASTPIVRYANRADLGFVAQDNYVSNDTVRRKIEAREVLVAELETRAVGYLRIEYLWSKLPYIALVRVLPDYRRMGVGSALLEFLEVELRGAGHSFLLSSSEASEPEPQAWHRRMGFSECGRLEGINAGGVDEVFFRKDFPAQEQSNKR
jgi:GNAT superfamily N-acetyltransferase